MLLDYSRERGHCILGALVDVVIADFEQSSSDGQLDDDVADGTNAADLTIDKRAGRINLIAGHLSDID